MKKYLFILASIMLSIILKTNAQDVVLEQKPDQEANSDFGANKAYFAQVSFGIGNLVGSENANLPVNNWRSTDFRVGIKLKRKINGLLSVWLEPEYHYAAYNLNQGAPKVTDSLFWAGSPLKHEKERLVTEGILFNGFLRLNFDPKRGNFLGYYLDLGAGADLIIDREYLAIDKNTNGSETRTSITNIPYINNFGYNCFARIGINWIGLTFNYRLSKLFKGQYDIPDPSVFTAGIEINPYTH